MNREKGGIFSSKPRKQRLMLYAAGLHTLGRRMSAHLSKELRKELGRRSMQVREGDRVKVMRGGKKGASGKITAVDRKRGVVFIEGITRKKADGKEVRIPVASSNLLVTEIERKDERRIKGGKAAGAAAGKAGNSGHGPKKVEAKGNAKAKKERKAGAGGKTKKERKAGAGGKTAKKN